MEFYKMLLSGFSVSCRCLALILIPVPVPGKELQGHSSQKLFPLVAAVTVSTEAPANIMMNKCVTKDQRPVLKRGLTEIICNGLTCTGNYRAYFNQSSCYYVCIVDIRYLKDSSKGNLLEFGNMESSETLFLRFRSDHACPSQGPSATPEADHGDLPVPISGYVEEQVVLPCTYKGNVSVSDLQVIWGTPKREIVHKFVDGNDDLREQDPWFRNRTNLFKDQLEQGNWSVLISDLREADLDEYQCQISSRMGDRFQLEEVVSVRLSVAGPRLPARERVGLGIGIGVFVVFVAIGVYFVRKHTRQEQPRPTMDHIEKWNGDPLSEVTCSSEAQSLVPTAPEHQDGAAGEQNLLGNRAVQH
ncbi:uncharacterized protein LOC125487957 [Rhincodon typus]|uniref:uncharacterized protein LOC125487957 n=1 Tax=Rhincodon typus TaxID=259920 RepID=UPI00202F50F1|nr:uncharacterized protein LOC125487957 [Rhincodon typus]